MLDLTNKNTLDTCFNQRGIVKKFIAVFVILIIFLSALSSHEANNSSFFPKSNHYVDSEQSNMQDVSSLCASGSDCDEHKHKKASECLSCRIGHGSYALSKSIFILDFSTEEKFIPIASKIYYYNYQFVLFRPPIS